MDGPERAVWFVGDLEDDWVRAIADALPGDPHRLSCAGGWTEGLFDPIPDVSTLVLHRSILSAPDLERLGRLRQSGRSALQVVLCVGPHARHAEVERWSLLVDAVVPEATARETIARHLRVAAGGPTGDRQPPGTRTRVSVVSGNFELRQALADACASAGFAAVAVGDWAEVVAGGLVAWDVPVLEEGWTRSLARGSRMSPTVALIGFADRALVRQAREAGALACLELPCDLADLVFVLERLSTTRLEPAHPVPPPPSALRRSRRAVAAPGPDAYN